MKRTLTVVDLKELPKGWQSNFPFEYLSVKPNRKVIGKNKEGRSSVGWVDQIAEAKRVVPTGVEVHAWEWFPATTVAEGKAFGERMGKLCTLHGLKRFYIDAEAQWSGGEGYPATKEPYATLFEFAVQFYLWAPEGCQLWFNGFSWSRASSGAKLYDADLLRCFAGRCVMTHGTDRVSLLKTARSKMSSWPGIKVIPQFGVGRKDKATGAVWGFWDVHKKILDEFKPDEVNWYMGNGAGDQYFGGHKDHPPLVECAREVGPAA